MSKMLPIVYSAHHASPDFGEFNNRCALTPEQRVRYSDYGTDQTVPKHTKYLVSDYSRGIVDLNRGVDNPTIFPELDFGKPQRHKIWLQGCEPTDDEKRIIQETVYETYHHKLLDAIRSFENQRAESTKPIVVIAWDNTAHYAIGKNPDGSSRIMQPFILSNNGDRERGDSINPEVKTTCNPKFIELLVRNFSSALQKQGLPSEVHMNTYNDTPNDECGYIASHYNTYYNHNLSENCQVEALQLEYDTSITHDQDLNPDYEAMERLRIAFEEAIEITYANLFT